MNSLEIEREIVFLFFKKNRRNRMLFELSSPRKRDKFFWNIAGTREFDLRVLHRIDNWSISYLSSVISQSSSKSKVYYIGASYIGECTCAQAIERIKTQDICLVYFGNGKGYYQGEIEESGQQHYVLIAKSK